MPRTGPGSVARLRRRVAALFVDWFLCVLVARALVEGQWTGSGRSFTPLLVFLVMNVVLVGTLGTTIGHRAMGLHVVRLGGGYVGVRRALVRSLLLCLAVPALIWDADQRGLHDKAAGTVIRLAR